MGINDNRSAYIIIFAIVWFVVASRSVYADSWILESGSGARKSWLPRGEQTMYDGTTKVA